MMKNTFKLIGIAWITAIAIVLAFAACRRPLAHQFCPKTHFSAWPVDGGTGMRITLYTGGNRVVRIPPTIRGVPVTEIGNEAFRRLSITSVTIPNSVARIGDFAFLSNQLTSVTIPNSVTSIGRSAFAWNQLTSITIPNSVVSIGEAAFDANRLTSIIIPDNVTSIGEGAFFENQLTNVTIGNGVTSIGGLTFFRNQLTSVTIPHNVTRIDDVAFEENPLLNRITIGANVQLQGNPFPHNFHVFYNNNGRRAGTYTWNGTAWSFR